MGDGLADVGSGHGTGEPMSIQHICTGNATTASSLQARGQRCLSWL